MEAEDIQQQRLRAKGLTPRAFLIGAAIVVGLCVAGPYLQFIVHTIIIFDSYLPVGLTFPFLIVVAVVNVLLKVLNRRWGISPQELTVIFIMVLVGGFPVTYGLTSYLLSIIAAPYYFATPEVDLSAGPGGDEMVFRGVTGGAGDSLAGVAGTVVVVVASDRGDAGSELLSGDDVKAAVGGAGAAGFPAD